MIVAVGASFTAATTRLAVSELLLKAPDGLEEVYEIWMLSKETKPPAPSEI